MDEFIDRLDRAAGPNGFAALLRREAQRAGLLGVRTTKSLLTTRKGVRSGRLRASVRHMVRRGQDGLELVLRAGGGEGAKAVRYARIQEEGGTVRPVTAQWLSIPVHPAVITPAGVSRFDSPRDVPEPLAFVTSARGNALLINSETGEPYYVLRKSVEIKAGHFLRDGGRVMARAFVQNVAPVIRAAVEDDRGI